ncbi:MAG: ABC transporter substrate-binding protein [Alphaproteobacteria bacterium]|nr:ABC transporter substrate-binding protein [Alphaproteobacteria bacterium]
MSELEFWRDQHAAGRISRREFLARAGALGAGAAMGTAMVASVEAQAADMPRKGGTLRLGLAGGSTTDSLDPGSYTDSVMIDAGHAFFNALVEWGEDGKPHPSLAESWEVKPGATEWILNIRKGVTFSNGKTLDADDIVYSLNMHRGKTKSGAAGPFKAVADVKKLAPSQVQVALTGGDADFPYVLTDYHVLIVPNGHTDWTKPVGTGGYVLETFEPGVRITGKRNPNYWKSNRAHVDAFDITVINDSSARLNALMTGQIDAMNRVDAKFVALVKKNPKLEIVRASGGWHAVISMMHDRPPFDNHELRLALKYGIDRERVIKALFSGYATPGNDHPIPRTDPYWNSELPQIKYDPDKAKFHLRKSGLTSPPLVLQCSDAAFSGAVDMAQLFQESAAKAGIRIDLKKEPADGFWDNVWLKGAFVTSYWAGRAAATQMLAVAYAPDAPWNESHYKSEKFAKLLAEARAETDEAKRKPMIWEMQSLLYHDGATIVPVFRDWLDAHNKNVGGHTPHGGFDMNNGWIVEQAWLKA